MRNIMYYHEVILLLSNKGFFWRHERENFYMVDENCVNFTQMRSSQWTGQVHAV